MQIVSEEWIEGCDLQDAEPTVLRDKRRKLAWLV